MIMGAEMKILIVSYNMKIGGIQKALLNLLEKLSFDNYDITLRLFDKRGELLSSIPENIEVEDCGFFIGSLSASKQDLIEDKLYFRLFTKAIFVALSKFINVSSIYKYLFKSKMDSKSYDVAISYSQDNYKAVFSKGCNQYVGERIISNCKIAFLHSDIIMEGGDYDDMKKKYSAFDWIVNVSMSGKRNFDSIFPEFCERSKVVYNLFNSEDILEAGSKYTIKPEEARLVFVTVSRLSYLKGIDRIKEITRDLKKANIENYIWYVVGEGEGDFQSDKLNRWCERNDLSNNLIFVGSKNNPYPYIKNADAFIFPTRTEAFPMVTIESLILGTPVITCSYSSAHEQIIDNIQGIIIENETSELFRVIKEILLNRNSTIKYMRKNLEEYNYDNEKIFRKLKDLFYNI